MNEVGRALERYRQADLDTRLNMVMEHRDLRHLFDQIETEEESALAVNGNPAFAQRSGCWQTGIEAVRHRLRNCCTLHRWA